MIVDLASGEAAALRSDEDRRLIELQQCSGFLGSHHLVAHLSQRSVTDHEPLVAQVLTYCFADELALALSRRSDCSRQVARVFVG
jgi:hypothetical protein